jgi:DNA-binding NarL/FixJ family response regulator
MIRLMLIDDHVSAREPLAFMLDHQPDMEVVATAGSLAEAREALDDQLDLDVAIVDLGLPDGSGAELIGTIHASNPRSVSLVLTSFSDQLVLARAISAGAAGVLHKSSDVSQIIEAVRTLHSGEQLVTARDVADAVRLAAAEQARSQIDQVRVESLTPRELEVLQALGDGLSDKEIAERLVLGAATVRTHVNSLLAKLGVQSRLQAVVFAARTGLIDLA